MKLALAYLMLYFYSPVFWIGNFITVMCSYSLRMSLSTVLFPAPIPPPIRRRTGLLSLWAIGTITSVHRESSVDTSPMALISSTNVVNTLATFKFLVTLSILCSLHKQRQKVRSVNGSLDGSNQLNSPVATNMASEIRKLHLWKCTFLDNINGLWQFGLSSLSSLSWYPFN